MRVNDNPARLNSELSAITNMPDIGLVCSELSRLKTMLLAELPFAREVSFEFDTALRVHIDVRSRDEVAQVEGILPMLGGGLFRDLRRAAKPRHPFMQRVSAVVG
jgi:hypothetical protein